MSSTACLEAKRLRAERAGHPDFERSPWPVACPGCGNGDERKSCKECGRSGLIHVPIRKAAEQDREHS